MKAMKAEKIVEEDGWCPICNKGTETGKTYCDRHLVYKIVNEEED